MSITTNLQSAPWKDVRLSFATNKLSLVISVNDKSTQWTDYIVFTVLQYGSKESTTLAEITSISVMKLIILNESREINK